MLKTQSTTFKSIVITIALLVYQESTYPMLPSPTLMARTTKISEQSELTKFSNLFKAYFLTAIISFFLEAYLWERPHFRHHLTKQNSIDSYGVRLLATLPKAMLVYLASLTNRKISEWRKSSCNVFAPQIMSSIVQSANIYYTINGYKRQAKYRNNQDCSDSTTLLITVPFSDLMPIILTHILDYKTGQNPSFEWNPSCAITLTKRAVAGAQAQVTTVLS